MSTIYKINRLCKINTNNPTPCKDDMDVAINIVPVDKNKEFENFVLGINNVQQCFECFGCGCTQADTVRYNITQEADSFNVTRRITVFNTRTDKVLMQMTGVMSLKTDGDTKELNVIVKDGETYHKHMIF